MAAELAADTVDYVQSEVLKMRRMAFRGAAHCDIMLIILKGKTHCSASLVGTVASHSLAALVLPGKLVTGQIFADNDTRNPGPTMPQPLTPQSTVIMQWYRRPLANKASAAEGKLFCPNVFFLSFLIHDQPLADLCAVVFSSSLNIQVLCMLCKAKW